MSRPYALTFCVFLLCLQATAQPGQKATPKPEGQPAAPKPAVSVSFARQTIREDDSVQVQVWLANESDQDLAEVKLHVAAPPFIKWRKVACADWGQADFESASREALDLGRIPAHAVSPLTLCLRSGPDISVGDFNLLFTFEYGWASQGQARRSLVSVEKTLKASLLGSDNIAGIPVGLAGFIVPGLFFWLFVTWWGVSWVPWKPGDLALGDKLIYSVLVSIFVVVVWAKFNFTYIRGGVGLVKLGYLAGVGAGLGAAVGGLDRLARFLLARRRERLEEAAEARQIKLGDDDDLLDKLLDTRPGARRPRAVVTLKTGQSFRGTLARQDRDATGMVGWFQVVLDGKPPSVAEGFRQLARARRWRDALAYARGNGLAVETRDPIYVTTGGVEDQEEYVYRTWKSEEVASVTNDDDAGDSELITPQ